MSQLTAFVSTFGKPTLPAPAPKPAPNPAGSEAKPVDLYKAKPEPAKLSAEQTRFADRLSRMLSTYGEQDGRTLFRMGLSEPQAATLFGTRLWAKLAKRDPAAELSSFKAATLLGIPAAVLTNFGPKPDRLGKPVAGRSETFYTPGTLAKFALLKSAENHELAERIGLGSIR